MADGCAGAESVRRRSALGVVCLAKRRRRSRNEVAMKAMGARERVFNPAGRVARPVRRVPGRRWFMKSRRNHSRLKVLGGIVPIAFVAVAVAADRPCKWSM